MIYTITADLHVSDPRNYNLPNNRRRDQFSKIAHKIVKKSKEVGSKVLILAGDTSDKPVVRPYILHNLMEVIDIFCEYYDQIYYINGQHDCDTKAVELGYSDSIMNIFDGYKGKVFYMHKKFLTTPEGHVTYFQDWSRGQDLSHLDTKVDLMIGHLTIGNHRFQGQDIDNTKFKLGLFGDIHAEVSMDNMHSISSPTQMKIDEPPESKIVLYNCTTRSWSRVDIDPENELPKIGYTSDKELEGPDEINNIYRVYKPPKTYNTQSATDLIPEWELIDELVDRVMSQRGLSELHELVKSKDFYSPIDFNFKLNRFTINNFRSIEHLDYEFNEGALILTGLNGSGKSSFISALLKCLWWDRSLKDNIRIGESYLDLRLILTYQGNIYNIYRHSHQGLTLMINGEIINAGNQTELNKRLVEELPFINHLGACILGPGTNELLSSIRSSERINLMAKHYRLDKLDSLRNTCINLSTDIQLELDKISTERSSEKILLEESNRKLESLDTSIEDNNDLDSLNQELESINQRVKDISEVIKLRTTISDLNVSLNSDRIKLSELNTRLGGTKLPELDLESSLEELKKLRADQEEFALKSSDLNTVLNEGLRLKNELDNIISSINIIKNKTCDRCSQSITSEESNKLISSLEVQRKSLEESKDSKLEIYTKLKSRVDELNKDYDTLIAQLDTKIKEYNEVKSRINSIESEIKLVESYISNKESTLASTESELSKYSHISGSEDVESLNLRSQELVKLINGINEIKELRKSIKEREDSIESLNIKYDEKYNSMESYLNYISLMERDGEIYTEVLNELTSKFTNDLFEFKTHSTRKSGKSYSDLSIKLKVKKTWIDYSALSSGQKNLCDIYFIYRCILSSGLLVFDEFLKFSDPNTIDLISGYISKMDINNIIIANHSDTLVMDSDKMSFELSDEGVSIISTY